MVITGDARDELMIRVILLAALGYLAWWAWKDRKKKWESDEQKLAQYFWVYVAAFCGVLLLITIVDWFNGSPNAP